MARFVACRLFLGVLLRTGAASANAGGALSLTWSKVEQRRSDSPAPAGRIPAGAISCLGALFVFGGERDDKANKGRNKYLNDVWRFAPEQGGGRGSWTELSPDRLPGSPAPRVSSSMVCSQGKLIVFGGLARTSLDETRPLSDVWSFDLDRSEWRQITQN